MLDTDAQRAHIRSGPQGPRIGAFFDFDGTIIDGYSASTLYRHRFRARQLGLGEAVRAVKAARGGPMTEQEFETFLTAAICGWTGRPQSYLDTLGEHVYREGIAKNLFHEAWRLVKAHQRAGHTVVIASSATRVQISTVARELGITHILCTELQVVDGVVTGRLAGRTLWGDGKEAAIRTFARRHRLPLANAYGYANGERGHPVPRPARPPVCGQPAARAGPGRGPARLAGAGVPARHRPPGPAAASAHGGHVGHAGRRRRGRCRDEPAQPRPTARHRLDAVLLRPGRRRGGECPSQGRTRAWTPVLAPSSGIPHQPSKCAHRPAGRGDRAA